MRRLIIACGVFLLVASGAFAQSSTGGFKFALEGAAGAITFEARMHGSSARGEIRFQGSGHISGEDVDGEGFGGGTLSDVSVTVNVDCLRVNGNRASIGGVVASASNPAFVGQRALLAVVDGGEGSKDPRDRFTWGVYRTIPISWTPEDAEVPGDPGWGFSWFATDAENGLDPGAQQNHGPVSVNCQSFGFDAYAFEEIAQGNLQVRP